MHFVWSMVFLTQCPTIIFITNFSILTEAVQWITMLVWQGRTLAAVDALGHHLIDEEIGTEAGEETNGRTRGTGRKDLDDPELVRR